MQPTEVDNKLQSRNKFNKEMQHSKRMYEKKKKTFNQRMQLAERNYYFGKLNGQQQNKVWDKGRMSKRNYFLVNDQL